MHARCLSGAPVLSASSSVVAVTINGVPVPVAGGVASQYPIPGIGTLYLNYQRQVDTDATPGPDTVTQRAVFLDSNSPSIPDIVVAEAIAGIRGCRDPRGEGNGAVTGHALGATDRLAEAAERHLLWGRWSRWTASRVVAMLAWCTLAAFFATAIAALGVVVGAGGADVDGPTLVQRLAGSGLLAAAGACLALGPARTWCHTRIPFFGALAAMGVGAGFLAGVGLLFVT